MTAMELTDWLALPVGAAAVAVVVLTSRQARSRIAELRRWSFRR